MSKEQVVSFFHEAVNNKNLAEDIRRIVERTSDPKTAANKLTFLAQEYGFEFTVEEAAAAIHSEDISFLSDEDLSNVVGGFGFGFASLLSSVMSIFSAVVPTFTTAFSKASSEPVDDIGSGIAVERIIAGSDDTTVNTSIDTVFKNVDKSEDDKTEEQRRQEIEDRLSQKIDDVLKKYSKILTSEDRTRLETAKENLKNRVWYYDDNELIINEQNSLKNLLEEIETIYSPTPDGRASSKDVEQAIVTGYKHIKKQVGSKDLDIDEVNQASFKLYNQILKKQKEISEKIKMSEVEKNASKTSEERDNAEKEIAELKKARTKYSKIRQLNQEEAKDIAIQHAISFPETLKVREYLQEWEALTRRTMDGTNQTTSRELSKSFKENLRNCSVHHESEYNGFTLNYGTEKNSGADIHYIFIDSQEGASGKSLDQKTVKALFDDLTSKIELTNNQPFTLIIGTGINKIGKEAFKVDASAKNKIMPLSVRIFSRISSIGAEAFANNTKLRDFSIEYERIAKNATCSSIEDGAFQGCTNLNKIDLKKVENVGNGAFEGCENLSEVYLPKVKHIGARAFSNCTSLDFFNVSEENHGNAEELEINLDKVETVGEYAFENVKVGKISSSESLKELGVGTFKGCDYLEIFNIQSSHLGKEVLDEAFDAGVLDKLHEQLGHVDQTTISLDLLT